MVTQTEIKRINKDSKLENISKGDAIEIVGITAPEQEEKGRVAVYDGNAKLVLVLVRNRDTIRAKTYFITPYGIKEGTKNEIYDRNHPSFNKHDNYLKEINF